MAGVRAGPFIISGGEIVRIDRFFLSPSPGRPSRFSSFPQFYSLFSSFLHKIPHHIHNKIHKKFSSNPPSHLYRGHLHLSYNTLPFSTIHPTDSLTECVSLGFIHTLPFFISTLPTLHRVLKSVFPLAPVASCQPP